MIDPSQYYTVPLSAHPAYSAGMIVGYAIIFIAIATFAYYVLFKSKKKKPVTHQ